MPAFKCESLHLWEMDKFRRFKLTNDVSARDRPVAVSIGVGQQLLRVHVGAGQRRHASQRIQLARDLDATLADDLKLHGHAVDAQERTNAVAVRAHVPSQLHRPRQDRAQASIVDRVAQLAVSIL